MGRANRSGPASAIKAGLAYFSVIFPMAFALGVLRVLLVAPAAGEARAVVLELLILLMVSWFASGFLVRRFRLEGLGALLGMGVLALILVLLGEAVIALAWLGRTLAEFLGDFRHARALLGLAGQLIFALLPAARWRIGAP